MKKCHQRKNYVDNEKNENNNINIIKKAKYIKSFDLEEIKIDPSKEKEKIYRKMEPKLKSDILLYHTKKSNFLYYKKKIENRKIRKNNISDINPIDKRKFLIKKEKNKNTKINENIFINDKNDLEGTILNMSQNSEVNNLINELKIKIDLNKRNINKINIKYDIPKISIKKIYDKTNSRVINNDNKIMNKKYIRVRACISPKIKKCLHIPFIRKSQSCEKKNYNRNIIKLNQTNNIYYFNFILSKIKNNNKINILTDKNEPFIIKYIDNKSLISFSSINKNIFKYTRIILYSIIYKKLLFKNNNNKEDFTKKIIYNIFNHSSKKLNFRNKIQLTSKYLFYKYDSSFKVKIIQDLSRTFPQDTEFNINSNYHKLYNILTAYSNYNKLIGYTQGLNFIAATGIYIFKTEEEVFLFLDCINYRFNLEKNLSIQNRDLSDNYNYFCLLLNKYVPEIVNYFELKGLNHCFFSISWMITLFSNSMKRKYLIKTWCFMILFGWKFFYSFVINILRYYKNEILSKEENKLSDYMKLILNDNNFCNNYKNIVKNTLNFMNDNIIL